MTKQLPFLLFILLLFTTKAYGQESGDLQRVWFPVRGKVFEQYPFLFPLTEKIAGVRDTASLYFLIDRKGKRMLPDTFTQIFEKQHPEQTYFFVWKNRKVFMVSPSLQLTEIQPFENYIWFPGNQVFCIREGSYFGIMDTRGVVLAQPRFEYIQEINGQIIVIQQQKYGVVRRDGSEMLPSVYDEIRVAGNGYFTVRKKDKTAVFAPDGRQLTNFEFEDVQVRPDGSFFAQVAGRDDHFATLYQKNGAPSGASNWRRITDNKYQYWLQPGRKYAEQYDLKGQFISKKFPADSVFDYSLSYHLYKDSHQQPSESIIAHFQNGAYQPRKTRKVYAPDGKPLFTTNLEINGGIGSFFRTSTGRNQYGLLNIRGEEILQPTYSHIDILPDGTIYARGYKSKSGLFDLKGRPLMDTVTYDKLTTLYPGYLVEKDSMKWVVNDNGLVIIPKNIQQISSFYSGYYFIQRKDKVLVMDSEGQVMVQSDTGKCQKINQLLKIKENGKWALALPSGEQLTPFQFDAVQHDQEYYTCYSENGIATYYFRKQEFQYFGPRKVLQVLYDHSLNQAKIVAAADGKMGIYKVGGKEIIPCIYDQITLGAQSIFIVRKGDSCTVFTTNFQKIAAFNADSVLGLANYYHLIVFRKNGIMGVFNPSNGKQLLVGSRQIVVYKDLIFASGKNTATVYSAATFEPVLPYEIDAFPEKLYSEMEFSGQYIVSKDGRSGMIDTTGRLTIPFEYNQIHYDFFTGILTMVKGETTDLYIPEQHKIFKSEGCKLHEATPFTGYYVTNQTFTGFIDYHLDWVIPLKYNYLELVDRVGFRACSDSRFGALSLKGDTILPFEYASLSYKDSDKTWTGEKAEPCKVKLPDGRKVLIPEADQVCGDFYRFIKVGKNIILTDFSGRKPYPLTSTVYGLVSKSTGKIVLPIAYDEIGNFGRGNIYIRKAGQKYSGLMDTLGNWLITPDSLLLDYIPTGFIGCTPGKKYGLFDLKGVLLLPLIYDEMVSWDYYNHVLVKQGNKWAVAKSDGTFITPFEFDFIGDAGQKTRINAVKNSLWGYIDKTGKEVVPFQYLYADEFSGNWGIVLTPEGYRLLNTDGTLHEAKAENRDDFFKQSVDYVNDTLPDGSKETHLMAEHLFRMFSVRQIRVTNVWRGVIVYEDLSKSGNGAHYFGMLDYSGKQLCPPVYDEINLDYSDESPALHLCRKGKLWGYIDFDGKEVIAPQFESANKFWGGKARVVQNGQEFFIDAAGNIVK